MTNCQFTLNELFRKAIESAFPDLPDAPVIVQASQGERFGDYQCNSAMAINQVMTVISFVRLDILCSGWGGERRRNFSRENLIFYASPLGMTFSQMSITQTKKMKTKTEELSA